MSLAAIWDRFWWSSLLTITIGLIWLKFIDPFIPCVSIGLILSIGVGIVYFAFGIRKMAQDRKNELEIEKKAYAELMAEMEEDHQT